MKGSQGLSLPEILLAISVTAVVGGLLINMMISSNTLFFDQSLRVSQGLSLNQASQEVTMLINSSAGIAGQYPPAGTAQYTTGADTLVLKIPAVNESGSIVDQVFDYGVVSRDPVNPRVLRRQIFVDDQSSRNAENKVLATSLDELTFEYLDAVNTPVSAAEAVRINFTINLLDNTNNSGRESNVSGTANLHD